MDLATDSGRFQRLSRLLNTLEQTRQELEEDRLISTGTDLVHGSFDESTPLHTHDQHQNQDHAHAQAHEQDPHQQQEAQPQASSAQSPSKAQAGIDLLRDLTFLDKVNEELLCPICTCPLVNPAQLPKCAHIFCADCLEQAWSLSLSNSAAGTRTCPSCRADHAGHLRAPPRLLNNMLDGLRVKCPREELGCEEEMCRRDVRYHLRRDCGFRPAVCPAPGCALMTTERMAELHLEEKNCVHAESECVACGETVLEVLMLDHRTTSCSAKSISCPHCTASLPASSLPSHACPKETIPCPGRSIGCQTSTQRAAMPAHQTTCTFAALLPAFKTLSEALTHKETTISALRRTSQRQQEQIDDLQREARSSAMTIRCLRDELHRSRPRSRDEPMSERLQMEFLSWQESVRGEVWREFELHRDQISERLTDMLRYHDDNMRTELQNNSQNVHWLRVDVDNLARLMRQQGRLPSSPGQVGVGGGMGGMLPLASSISVPGAGPSSAGQMPIRRMSDGSSRSDTKL